MKKLMSMLVLSAMLIATLASCGGGETDTTTAAPAPTDKPAATTTQAPPPETLPPDDNPTDVPTAPMVKGDGLEELLEGKISLNEAGKIDMETLATVGFSRWAETEDIAQLFDTIDTYDEWYFDENGELKADADPNAAEGPTGGGPGKCGGGVSTPAYFYFGLTEKATLAAYVLTTGNDNSRWNGRNPIEWTLYGTNDLSVFEGETLDGNEFDETKWTVLDYVYDGLVIEDNFVPCGYEIDADKQGEFQYYVWVLGYNGGAFQATELDLFVKAN